jgi:hypothetical protein
MKALEALAIVVLILLAIGLAIRAGIGVVKALRSNGCFRWELIEHSDGELVRVTVEKSGEQPLLIGAVPFAAREFEDRLYTLRAEARDRAYALNQQP